MESDKMDNIDRRAMRKLAVGKKNGNQHRVKISVREIPEMLEDEE